MKFTPTDVEHCTVVMMDRYYDDRGFFQELYEQDKYTHGIDSLNWQQTNWSVSNKNVLRGIHVANYAKLVTCVSGKVWDLVVDLRPDSSTFLKYVGVELSPDEPKQIYVPPGCGHGFVALEDNSSVVYMQTGRFAKEGELTVMYNEPNLNIQWPGDNHIISERDKSGQPLWSFQMCLDVDMDYQLNDQFQSVWVASLPPESQEEWNKKYSKSE